MFAARGASFSAAKSSDTLRHKIRLGLFALMSAQLSAGSEKRHVVQRGKIRKSYFVEFHGNSRRELFLTVLS